MSKANRALLAGMMLIPAFNYLSTRMFLNRLAPSPQTVKVLTSVNGITLAVVLLAVCYLARRMKPAEANEPISRPLKCNDRTSDEDSSDKCGYKWRNLGLSPVTTCPVVYVWLNWAINTMRWKIRTRRENRRETMADRTEEELNVVSGENLPESRPANDFRSASDGRDAVRFRASKVLMALPAYNEEVALPELLERIGEAFADSGIPYEVVIVDDGSSDDTAKIASQMSFQMPIHLVQHQQNQGLGITLRDGLREAVDRAGERDIIVTMDADNTHPPGLIDRMVRMIHEGCDVVIASRFEHGARVMGVPIERHFLSIGARVLFTLLFPTEAFEITRPAIALTGHR